MEFKTRTLPNTSSATINFYKKNRIFENSYPTDIMHMLNFIQQKIVQLLLVVAFFGSTTAMTAQEQATTTLRPFKIVISQTADGLQLHSTNGSAWVEIAFSLNSHTPQAIDEYGMTTLATVATRKDPNLADFLFTIIKTENGIALKGIEGTAWTALEFSLSNNQSQAIDQFGMTGLE